MKKRAPSCLWQQRLTLQSTGIDTMDRPSVGHGRVFSGHTKTGLNSTQHHAVAGLPYGRHPFLAAVCPAGQLPSYTVRIGQHDTAEGARKW